ncbi:hypothetical protein Ahy_B06g082614 [Arachis hypogaea]|uniref:Putative plant transposon protein domain-containing protein n=1 Tax=Arachis hypogaea TaxID=3818 RepID=A0A444YNU0_ARAHY|nr:hypothetical protein Ahy_B06g082614 [Arachis hypogaea]
MILNRLNFYHWEFVKFNPVEVNEHQVKEFYANFLKRDVQTVFLRGVTLDTSDTALKALLDIPHISPARDALTQLMKDVSLGKISLDVVLEKIGQPEARWEYSKGDNAVPLSIACNDLNPEARIWQRIIADYILPSTHDTHIRIWVAVLLWAILKEKRISILPLIRESMIKVNQQLKFNIPFPSLITRLAALSGVERRPRDRTSVYISKQPFRPYRDYDGPPQKKRKTTEPPTAAVEPSAPPTAPIHTSRPQTLYELCRDILQAVHRYERRNACRFQWIVAKFEGRDPGPPPPDTLEPEAEEPASEEPAAEAGQAVEQQEQPEPRPIEPAVEEVVVHTAEKPRVEELTAYMVEEPTAKEPRVEEQVAGPAPIVEMAVEIPNPTVEQPRAETAPVTSRELIVYHHHHHHPSPSYS